MTSKADSESLYPTELEMIEIARLTNATYAIGSAVCCTYAEFNAIRDESEALNIQKWQYSFVTLLILGLVIDTYFKNFGLGFNLGIWISAFAVLQLWLITFKAAKHASKVDAIKDKLTYLDLEWAKIHGCVLNNDTFLLGELREAVDGDRFYSNSDVFLKWCDKQYDKVFEMVAGAHKLAEKNKPYKSRLPD